MQVVAKFLDFVMSYRMQKNAKKLLRVRSTDRKSSLTVLCIYNVFQGGNGNSSASCIIQASGFVETTANLAVVPTWLLTLTVT